MFRLAPEAAGGAWTLTILHNFGGPPSDGNLPYAGLVMGEQRSALPNHIWGGAASCARGTVVSLTPPATKGGAWTETVRHSFAGYSSDGSNPLAGVVIDSTGLLHGTASSGGANEKGTVFSLTP